MVAEKGHTGRACTSRETMHGPKNGARAELARAGKPCTGRETVHGPNLHEPRNHARAEKRCTGRETVHGPSSLASTKYYIYAISSYAHRLRYVILRTSVCVRS